MIYIFKFPLNPGMPNTGMGGGMTSMGGGMQQMGGGMQQMGGGMQQMGGGMQSSGGGMTMQQQQAFQQRTNNAFSGLGSFGGAK